MCQLIFGEDGLLVVASCLFDVYQYFRCAFCLHYQDNEPHETAWCHLHSCHYENLNSHIIVGDSIAVEMYLEFACCAAVPGGGRNKEYALHLLHMCHGNIHVSINAFQNPGEIIIETTRKSIQYL